MFSFRRVLVVFIFALITIVGSTNGQQDCEDELSQKRTEMADEQARRSSESAERMGRITLSCNGYGGGSRSGGNNGSATIIEISFGLFFLIWVAVGIWFVFVSRQKAMNAAAITPYSGEVGAREGYGMDEKAKTVAMGAPAGKVSYADNNV